MAPNIQETDLENFREEDDEDLKVFHKTKKATKMVWIVYLITNFTYLITIILGHCQCQGQAFCDLQGF